MAKTWKATPGGWADGNGHKVTALHQLAPGDHWIHPKTGTEYELVEVTTDDAGAIICRSLSVPASPAPPAG